MLGIVTFGILIFIDSTFMLGAERFTDAFVNPTPMLPPTETFEAATFRFIDGILIFGASILRLGAEMLTDALPPMPPRDPPTETFGAATFRLMLGIVIFGA